jgi:biotin carboxyl carrier protein
MLQISVNDKHQFEVVEQEGQLRLDDSPADCDIQWQPGGLISILYKGKSYTATVEKADLKQKELQIRIDGQIYNLTVREPIDQLLGKMGMDLKATQKIEPIKAPMPGLVLKVMVSPGQQIKKGEGLLVLEAMKMENVLKAPADAMVKSVKVGERTAVEKGVILIELE